MTLTKVMSVIDRNYPDKDLQLSDSFACCFFKELFRPTREAFLVGRNGVQLKHINLEAFISKIKRFNKCSHQPHPCQAAYSTDSLRLIIV